LTKFGPVGQNVTVIHALDLTDLHFKLAFFRPNTLNSGDAQSKLRLVVTKALLKLHSE